MTKSNLILSSIKISILASLIIAFILALPALLPIDRAVFSTLTATIAVACIDFKFNEEEIKKLSGNIFKFIGSYIFNQFS